MIDFNIIVNSVNAGVSKDGFGRIALLTSELDVDYTLVTDLRDIDIEEDTETYIVLSKMFAQKPRPKEVLVIGEEGSDYSELLNTLEKETEDFFFITAVGGDDSDAISLATKVETLEKVYMATLREVESVENLSKAELQNTFVVCQEEDYPAEALAVVMSYDVGGKTAHFQQLNGVEYGKLAKEDIDKVLKANGNVYVRKMGQNQISGGRVTSGQWLDIVLGAYWIKFTLEERIMNLALNEDKIPYTNKGIGMLAGTVGTVLSEAEDRGILSNYSVDYRNAEDVSPEEKATRVYNYLTAIGQLQGAIHGGDITIDLVYEEVEA